MDLHKELELHKQSRWEKMAKSKCCLWGDGLVSMLVMRIWLDWLGSSHLILRMLILRRPLLSADYVMQRVHMDAVDQTSLIAYWLRRSMRVLADAGRQRRLSLHVFLMH